MSNSFRTISLPKLVIPDRWDNQLKRQAVLALDLTYLCTTYDDTIDDLLASTKGSDPSVAALWVEAAVYIKKAIKTWIQPLRAKIRGYLTRDEAQHELGGAPAARFLNGTVVTLSSIVELLNASCEAVQTKLEMWERMYPCLAGVGDMLPTKRTLPEILVQAIMISGRDWKTASNKEVEAWLGSVRDLRPREPISNPLKTGFDSLSSAPWRELYRLRPARANLGVGSVACVCALWTGRTLFTGSTLYKWGDALSKVVIEEAGTDADQPQASDLHKWARDLRQSRFTDNEQSLLNALVERLIEDYGSRMQKLLGKTEAELRSDTKRSETKGSSEKRPQLLHQLKIAKETVLRDLQNHWHHKLPLVIKETFLQKASPILGMSYEGQGFRLKRKCPICSTIYIFPVARNDEVERLEQDWQVVGEADLNKIGFSRGCCAEAICFVDSLHDLGVFRACLQQVGLKESSEVSTQR